MGRSSLRTIAKQVTFLFCTAALMGWMSLPGHCLEPPREDPVKPFIAYGASATTQEVVGTTFENRDKAHSVLTTPNNRSVYVPYVKDNNAMFQYRFDPQSGVLQSLDPPQVDVPDGVGPRHVAFHPTRPFVFFSNEQHLGVTSYRMASDGRLSLIHICDPGEWKPANGLAASDIAITPDGHQLFVAVRDFANDKRHGIHRYEVQKNGQLVHLGETGADAIPWGLKLSPDGSHLLVTAANGETLSAWEIARNGNLAQRSSIKWGNMIRAIAVVTLK